jgi:hypothetical protein
MTSEEEFEDYIFIDNISEETILNIAKFMITQEEIHIPEVSEPYERSSIFLNFCFEYCKICKIFFTCLEVPKQS